MGGFQLCSSVLTLQHLHFVHVLYLPLVHILPYREHSRRGLTVRFTVLFYKSDHFTMKQCNVPQLVCGDIVECLCKRGIFFLPLNGALCVMLRTFELIFNHLGYLFDYNHINPPLSSV